MRISTKEGDSGYNTWQDMSKAVVTLDGDIMYDVLTADEMLGYVIIMVPQTVDMFGYERVLGYKEEKHFGRVVITFN